MDYEKKYKEALKRAKKCLDENRDTCFVRPDVIFPELAESEDEKIRKDIIKFLIDVNNGAYTKSELEIASWIAWLEKQGKKPKKVSIWKHWTGGIAGNSEGEQIFLIKIGNIYSISSCLGYECDYIELSELDKLMLEEKQGKSKWTEEDEERLQSCISTLQGKGLMGGVDTINTKWLKSLKQRIGE